jgi:RNA polymerase sigma-70 factor (ECF subfamily)
VLTPRRPTPHDELEGAHGAHRLRRALTALPESYRRLLVLYELEGRPAEEVGPLLGLAPETVRVRAHRGRARLRAALEAAGPTARADPRPPA